MRKYILCIMLVAAMLLSACGAAQVGNQAATAVTGPEAASAISEAGNQAGTAIAAPESGTALSEAGNQLGTAVSGPEAATAMAAGSNALSAAEEDVTAKQGEQLVLDATKSVGDITNYKWTIQKAPAGAESVVGQTIKESSSGNLSLNPDDYAKYFPKSGDYTVRLTVTDSKGGTSYDDFTVTVP